MTTNNCDNFANPIAVSTGGLGAASQTAYAVLCGGTSTTNPVQSIAAVGNSTNLLISNGASALPTFQAAPSAGSLVLIQSQTFSGVTTVTFNTNTNIYSQYYFMVSNLSSTSLGSIVILQMSNDGGSTWVSSGYLSAITYNNYNSTTLTNLSGTSGWVVSPTILDTSIFNSQFYVLNCNVGAKPWVTGTLGSFTSGTGNFGYLGGQGGSTGANAFKFFSNTVRVINGTITLYGLKTS